jgi:hypothetical protein
MLEILIQGMNRISVVSQSSPTVETTYTGSDQRTYISCSECRRSCFKVVSAELQPELNIYRQQLEGPDQSDTDCTFVPLDSRNQESAQIPGFWNPMTKRFSGIFL